MRSVNFIKMLRLISIKPALLSLALFSSLPVERFAPSTVSFADGFSPAFLVRGSVLLINFIPIGLAVWPARFVLLL
jgi:hypothetical protein